LDEDDDDPEEELAELVSVDDKRLEVDGEEEVELVELVPVEDKLKEDEEDSVVKLVVDVDDVMDEFELRVGDERDSVDVDDMLVGISDVLEIRLVEVEDAVFEEVEVVFVVSEEMTGPVPDVEDDSRDDEFVVTVTEVDDIEVGISVVLVWFNEEVVDVDEKVKEVEEKLETDDSDVALELELVELVTRGIELVVSLVVEESDDVDEDDGAMLVTEEDEDEDEDEEVEDTSELTLEDETDEEVEDVVLVEGEGVL
ncbi:hypothetical protein GRF29_103g261374, partial [Pseudopithomyces chartarum]